MTDLKYQTVSDVIAERDRLRAALAASQAREAKLREALDTAMTYVCAHADDDAIVQCGDAQSMPSDDTALREMIAAEREVCAADLKRYRWLRDEATGGEWSSIGNTTSGERTDAAIDAAIRAMGDG